MLLTIDAINQNSGKGSPVFSNRAKQFNTLFHAFNNPTAIETHPSAAEFEYDKWVKDFKEVKYKEKFDVSLLQLLTHLD